MGIKVANNAASTIVGDISSVGTAVTVVAGTGALFPTLSVGDYFYATLINTAGVREIVRVTARVGDAMTIVRSQEGTLAQAFPAKSRFELRITAASITDMVAEFETASSVPPGDDVYQSLQDQIEALEAAGGGQLKLLPVANYGIDRALLIDPVRVGITGNAATIDASNLLWVDPASKPELTVNGNMSNSTPSPSDARAYTGWQIGTTTGTTAAFSGGQAAFTSGGVQMDLGATWNAVANGTRYLEVGQQITAAVGDLVRITATIDWVRSVIITSATGETTQATMNVFIGAPRGADGSPRALSNMVVASHPSITARKSDFYDETETYLGPKTYTIDYLVGTAQFVDPFIRVQSNASARLTALSCKVLPNNSALVFTCNSDQYGHQLHQVESFRLRGHSAPVSGQQIDAITMDSASPLSSRIIASGLQILGSGFRYGVEMGHGTYLCSFTDCYLTGAVAGIHTKPDSVDSGENINIRGGVVFSPFGIAIWNEGNFQINAFGMSSDFPRQWFKGTGQNRFVACHFEKNGFQGQEGDNLPMIHVEGGQFDVLSGRIQVNQSYFTALRAPFLVEAPGVATFENVNMSNMECTEDVLAVGGGKIRCRGTIGGANIPTLVHRNYEDNAAGDGRFVNSMLSPDSWVSSNGFQANNASLSLIAPIALASTYTVTAADRGKAFSISGALSSTVTLPSAASVGAGYYVVLKNEAYVTNTIVVNPVGGETINGNASITISVLGTYAGNSGNIRTLISTGSSWFTPDARLRNTQYSIEYASGNAAYLYAFTGVLTTSSPTLTATTQLQFSGQPIAGYRIYGVGLDEYTSVTGSVLPTTNNNGTVSLNRQGFRPTAPAAASYTMYNPTPTGTGTVTFDPTVYRTDYSGVAGYGSAKVTKGSGVTLNDSFFFNQIIPLEAGCGIGFESFVKLEPLGSDASDVIRRVYVRKYWARSTDRDSYDVPILEVDEYLNTEDVLEFQSSTGKRLWSFAANTVNGSPNLTNLTAGLFAPYNKIQIGDEIVGTGIPAGATVSNKIVARVSNVITYTLVLSANATATGTDVPLTAYAADPWGRTSYSNLNAPVALVRPDWATHLHVRYDISGFTGPRSIWVTDTMATPW